MSDHDLSRPLAPCSLNFTLADVTVTDRSGVMIVILGTYNNGSDYDDGIREQPLMSEDEEEVKLTKSPYDPDPELKAFCTYAAQTAGCSLRSKNGTAGQVDEFEMVDRSLPYSGDLTKAAANRDRAAIRVIMDFRQQRCKSLADNPSLAISPDPSDFLERAAGELSHGLLIHNIRSFSTMTSPSGEAVFPSDTKQG